MYAGQGLFASTGSVHGAAAFDAVGRVHLAREDVGRHNAVDKCLGELLITDSLDQVAILAVSGRVSYEIVAKCYRAGIPILCAVSAPTSLAITTAERLGISLLGFCRAPRATIYSHPENLIY